MIYTLVRQGKAVGSGINRFYLTNLDSVDRILGNRNDE